MKKTATDIVIEVMKRCTTHEPADCDGCPFFSRKNCVRDRDLAVIDTLVDQQARIKELQAKLEKAEKKMDCENETCMSECVNYVRSFVKDQLEVRGYNDLTDKQIDDLTHWFEHWFDDSHDMISDALSYAFFDCSVPVRDTQRSKGGE